MPCPFAISAENISSGFSKTVRSANRNSPWPRSNFEHASISDFNRAGLVVTVEHPEAMETKLRLVD